MNANNVRYLCEKINAHYPGAIRTTYIEKLGLPDWESTTRDHLYDDGANAITADYSPVVNTLCDELLTELERD